MRRRTCKHCRARARLTKARLCWTCHSIHGWVHEARRLWRERRNFYQPKR